MKYKDKFNKTYDFYLSVKDTFNFCGTLNPKYEIIYDEEGVDAKEWFFNAENGKNLPTYEKELCEQLQLCKASINFNIKLWVEGWKDYSFYQEPMEMFTQKELVWNTNGTFKYKSLQEQYNFPDWVHKAFINQLNK